MKHTKLIALVLTTALLAALLIACDSRSSGMKAAAGAYEGQYIKMVGDTDDDRDTSKAFRLTLTADGKGTHERDDLTLNVTWTLDGEKITVQETFIGAKLDYTGTLKDGELHLFNGNPEDSWTAEYVYLKQ